MSIIKASGAGEVSTGFYNGVATQSLRFNGISEHTTLWRKMASDPSASRRKAVFSWWMKGNLDVSSPYFWSKGSGGGVADIFSLLLNGDRLQVIEYVHDSNTMSVITSRKFRDPSAWYHIVFAFDSTQATASNRVCIYVNGVKETAFDTSTIPGQNHDHVFGYYQTSNSGSTVERIGGYQGTYTNDTGSGGGTGDANSRFNGYMSEWNYIDGLSFFSDTSGTANTSFNINSFGEFSNGIWIPKAYSGSYGNWGYRLEFKNTSVGSGSSSTVGADTSGNDHHWTSTVIAANDCNKPDCPENNFAVINPYVHTTGFETYNNLDGMLTLSKSGTTYSYFQSTFGVTKGKWYAECRPTAAITAGSFYVGISEMNLETYRTGENVDPHLTAGSIWYASGGAGYYDGSSQNASTFSSSTSYVVGDVIGVALDMDSSTKTVKFYKNGSLVTTKNLTSNFTDHVGFAQLFYNTNNAIWNFGQDSTFSGNETVATNSDGNGIGEFHESVPSGYLALCSSNLDDDNYATIGPTADNNTTDFFKTTYYAGTNDATRTFDLGFVSDWAWFKGDSSGYGHQMYDSSRGVQKYLRSNTTGTETTNSEGVLDFDDSGNLLKIGTDAFLNESGTSVSLWTWRINGGTTSTNGDGSANSTVQVNQTVGMSLVLYTGNATGSGAEQTIGHGLGAIPDVIMFKSRTYASQNWYIHHKGLANGVTTHVELDTNDLEHGDADYMNEVAPTSSVFSLGYNFTTNKSGESYIAYCFKSVEGYSKYGNFTGNGSTDGAYVYLGFRPQLIIAKCSSHSGSWHMVDATRDYNPIGYYNTDNADAYGDYAHYDILSNGFKVRDNGTESNRSGGTFIYMAWANSPFKYANAR